MSKSLEIQKAQAEKELCQLQNRQKILLNRIRSEERRARNHRLIVHGTIWEGVFPAAANTKNESVKAFLIELSHLPRALRLTDTMGLSSHPPAPTRPKGG